MLSHPGPAGSGREDEPGAAGFTVIELMVVCLVMAIVLSIAGDGLISFMTASSRNSVMVGEEQTASTVMTQLAADIRGATGITFPANVSPSVEVELNETNPAVTGGEILWVYDQVAGTLTRQEYVGGAWVGTGFQVTHVTNTAGQAVFTYYDSTAASVPAGAPVPMPAADQSSVEVNATAIGVNLHVSGPVAGTPAYHFTNEVTMTNVINATEPPGEGA